MKSLSFQLCLAVVVTTWIAGCGPKPVADDANRPAAEVIVTPETTDTTPPERDQERDATGVDVQVGGGQGVQVEVERNADPGN